MASDDDIRQAFEELIADAYGLSPEIGAEAAEVLRLGMAQPLTAQEARALLTRVVDVLRDSAAAHEDPAARAALSQGVDEVVERAMRSRVALAPAAAPAPVTLESRDGVTAGPVSPSPTFHGVRVPMNQGFVRVRDVVLWDANERIEIHLNQFRQTTGRDPGPDELLDIMLSRLGLTGLTEDDRADQFKVVGLARSIAVNGVRRPPILDVDGTLLDGNRRVAACRYILDSDEFSVEEKQRAEWVFAWQLTTHATDTDRDAVVVSLNFEPDNKVEWPPYIKARKVSEAWQEMLAVLPHAPGQREQATMKRTLSQRFALGPDPGPVTRYLEMTAWAQEFEDHHIVKRSRDPFEVQHRASKHFEYFDELSKGKRPGGVAYALKEDDRFRELVFDLLFDGKFKNWRQIRDLKYVSNDEDAYEQLLKARDAEDVDDGQEHLDNAVSIARLRSKEARTLGANTRIDQFVDWLEQLPVSAFRDQIRVDSLRRLLDALALVRRQAETALEDHP